jgi:hypothetical protein
LGQDAGEREALLLTAREPFDAVAAAMLQADPVQSFVDARVHFAARHGQVLQAEGNFLLEREHAELSLRVLEDHAHTLRHVRHRRVTSIAPVDADATLQVTLDEVRDGAIQAQAKRAFAAPTRTE